MSKVPTESNITMLSSMDTQQHDRDGLIARWRKELDEIKMQEVAHLFWRRKIFRRVFDVIESNPRINKWNPLYEWMHFNYVICATVTVRKLLDSDRRHKPMSLANLVEDICSHASVITRQWFTSQYSLESMRKYGFADRDFDRFSGGTGDTLDATFLRQKLDTLQTMALRTRTYVDKLIAHRDRKPPDQVPTHGELDEVIDGIGELLKELNLLLYASSIADLEPVAQSDWEWVFREPWIPRNPNEPASEETAE